MTLIKQIPWDNNQHAVLNNVVTWLTFHTNPFESIKKSTQKRRVCRLLLLLVYNKRDLFPSREWNFNKFIIYSCSCLFELLFAQESHVFTLQLGWEHFVELNTLPSATAYTFTPYLLLVEAQKKLWNVFFNKCKLNSCAKIGEVRSNCRLSEVGRFVFIVTWRSRACQLHCMNR